jgi:hypothetical protein
MKATPEGSNTASKKPTLFIDKNDRRLNKQNIGKTLARSNAEVSFVDLSGLGGIAGANLRANSGLPAADTPGTGTGGAGSGGGAGTVGQGNAPLQVANLSAQYVGDSIQASFTFDTTDAANLYFSSFIVQVYNPGTSTYIPLQTFSSEVLSKTSSSQTLNINPSQLSYTGLSNLTVFTKIEIATFAAQYTNGYVESNTFSYTCDLPAPVITVAHSVASYTVTITNFSTLSAIADFSSVAIQEFVSGDTLTQVQAEDTAGTSTWNLAGPQTTTNIETFLAADGNHRWVRAYAYTKSGGKSPVSNYVDVTPDALNPSNLTAPNNVTSATAAFSGHDVVITFTQASTNPGSNINVKLVPVINGTPSSSIYQIFTQTLVNGATTYTIPQSQLTGRFGQEYVSFQAHVYTSSQQNVPSNGTIDIGTFSQTNNLSGFTPQASIINAVSGYGVNFSLGTSGADYGEIYQFYQNPTFMTSTSNPPDYMDAAYQGGTGTSTLVVNNLTYEGGSMSIPSATDPTQYFGYQITGNGITSDSNVFVSAITYNSGTQQYSLSLSYYNASGTLTPYVVSSASGSYHLQCLVYSGSGPASVYNTLYVKPLYVVVAYYTYGGFRTNNSYPTYTYTATPINPAQSLIQNAVQVGGTAGAIYVGSSASTGARIVLGVDSYYNTSNSYSGIFAYDGSATTNTAPTTSIISNAGSYGYTFKTTNALIANWAIGTVTQNSNTINVIQNTLSSGSTYTGLSQNGTYAFWAGSLASGGDTNQFAVKPDGTIYAKNIIITGGSINVGAGAFSVDSSGALIAGNANITGSLNVSLPSTFNSNINMTSSGIFSAFGTLADGTTTATQTAGSSVQIRGGGFTDTLGRSISGGLFAYDTGTGVGTNHNITTWIVAKPIPFTLNGRTTGFTFQTNAALFGSSEGTGWIVQDSTIQSGNGRITLNASSNTITVGANGNSNYGVVLSAAASADQGTGGTPTGYAISAGLISGTPNFSVDHTGTLTATGATISGTLKSASRTSTTDTTHTGYVFNSSDGSFIAGSTTSYIQYNGSTNPINIIANASRVLTTSPNTVSSGTTSTGADTAYAGPSLIQVSPSGVYITGLPIQGNMTLDYSTWDYNFNNVDNTRGYLNIKGLGPVPRQRALVEDPTTGVAKVGFAIYYQDLNVSTSVPNQNSGAVGDLWVSY